MARALTTGVVLGLVLIAARLSTAADADVEEKLFRAKRDYTAEAERFKKSVLDLFEKREEAARSTGDKKLVDKIKAERKAFEVKSDLPAAADRQKVAATRTALDRAYQDAVKDYVRLKKDDAAEATEKERKEFLVSSALLLGRKKYLSTLPHFNVKVENNWFSNDGKAVTPGRPAIRLRGEPAPHSILAMPQTQGAAEVSYKLAGKWSVFRASVGVPRIEDDAQAPASPLTFEVLGDEQSLWKSKPIDQLDFIESCDLRVDKVKILTLRVHCPQAAAWARSVWFEPFLIE